MPYNMMPSAQPSLTISTSAEAAAVEVAEVVVVVVVLAAAVAAAAVALAEALVPAAQAVPVVQEAALRKLNQPYICL